MRAGQRDFPGSRWQTFGAAAGATPPATNQSPPSFLVDAGRAGQACCSHPLIFTADRGALVFVGRVTGSGHPLKILPISRGQLLPVGPFVIGGAIEQGPSALLIHSSVACRRLFDRGGTRSGGALRRGLSFAAEGPHACPCCRPRPATVVHISRHSSFPSS